MSDCASIDLLVTPYVDGELPAGDSRRLEQHLQDCTACRARVDAERTVCALFRRRQADLRQSVAPAALRARCEARPAPARVVPFVVPGTPGPVAPSSQSSPALARRALPSTRRVSRWAAAALVVLALGSVVAYRATAGATQAIAAELTADHVKCFLLNAVLRTHDSVSDVEAYMRSGFDWEAELPEHPEEAGLHLVGSRPCFYEHGKVAHIMYRHKGVPVSIFMLPGLAHREALVEAFGHEAVIWSDERRTYVLIAKAPHAEVQEVATFVRASLR